MNRIPKDKSQKREIKEETFDTSIILTTRKRLLGHNSFIGFQVFMKKEREEQVVPKKSVP